MADADGDISDPEFELREIELQQAYEKKQYELEQRKLKLLARQKRRASGPGGGSQTPRGERPNGSSLDRDAQSRGRSQAFKHDPGNNVLDLTTPPPVHRGIKREREESPAGRTEFGDREGPLVEDLEDQAAQGAPVNYPEEKPQDPAIDHHGAQELRSSPVNNDGTPERQHMTVDGPENHEPPSSPPAEGDEEEATADVQDEEEEEEETDGQEDEDDDFVEAPAHSTRSKRRRLGRRPNDSDGPRPTDFDVYEPETSSPAEDHSPLAITATHNKAGAAPKGAVKDDLARRRSTTTHDPKSLPRTRPEAPGLYYSVSSKEWQNLSQPAQDRVSRVYHIENDTYGMPAPKPCKTCRSQNHKCRALKPEYTRGAPGTVYACARCSYRRRRCEYT